MVTPLLQYLFAESNPTINAWSRTFYLEMSEDFWPWKNFSSWFKDSYYAGSSLESVSMAIQHNVILDVQSCSQMFTFSEQTQDFTNMILALYITYNNLDFKWYVIRWLLFVEICIFFFPFFMRMRTFFFVDAYNYILEGKMVEISRGVEIRLK